MDKKYFLIKGDIDSISAILIQKMQEKFESFHYVDNTNYVNREYKNQIDTFEIYSLLERGYLTVNIYYYEKTETDMVEIKTSIFSPTGRTSLKAKKILKEIEKIISHFSNCYKD